MKTTSLQIYCVANEGAGVARGTVFQEIRPGAGFKIGVFVEETLGGGGYRRERVGVDKKNMPISKTDTDCMRGHVDVSKAACPRQRLWTARYEYRHASISNTREDGGS